MSKLAEKNKELFGRYHYLVAPLFAILAGYAGIDGYGMLTKPEVNVTIEAPKLDLDLV